MANAATDILLWTGAAGDNDADTTGNYTILSGSPAAGIPSTGEGLAFNDFSVSDLLIPPGSAVALNNVRVAPDTNINFGTSSTPITNWSVTSGTTPALTYGGDCPNFYWSGDITSLGVNRTGGGEFVLVGGTAATATFQQGKVTVGGAAAFTTGYVTGAHVYVLNNTGAAPTTVYMMSGLYDTDRDYATMFQHHGTVITKSSAKASTSHVIMGGLLDVKSNGTIAQVLGLGGRLSAVNSQRPFTITTLVENVLPGMFTLDEESAGSLVTVTTRTKIGSK